ncbi:MAG: hypothetical protein PHE06_09895 [Lachnospiraceae bacterium]|nr:hypothetical protein [Lachnospiraceae bacterium]MDD3796260.1 hypothetical protein [Lachnospiraceae bacterium]
MEIILFVIGVIYTFFVGYFAAARLGSQLYGILEERTRQPDGKSEKGRKNLEYKQYEQH